MTDERSEREHFERHGYPAEPSTPHFVVRDRSNGARLTEEDVAFIRYSYAPRGSSKIGLSITRLAQMFQRDRKAIRQIIDGLSYKPKQNR